MLELVHFFFLASLLVISFRFQSKGKEKVTNREGKFVAPKNGSDADVKKERKEGREVLRLCHQSSLSPSFSTSSRLFFFHVHVFDGHSLSLQLPYHY